VFSAESIILAGLARQRRPRDSSSRVRRRPQEKLPPAIGEMETWRAL